MLSVSLDYWAGFIDGEGTIGIHLSTRLDRGHRRNAEYVPQSSACQSSKGGFLIEYLYSKWGGTIYKRNKNRPNWQDSIEWTVRGPKCKAFLEEITPHLILKKRQAELVLEFFGLHGERGQDALYPKVKLQQMEIYNELRKLNSKGTVKLELSDPEVLSNGRIYYRFSKAELEKFYLEKKLSAREIAEQYGTKTSTVNHALRRFGVPTRAHSEYARLGSERSNKVKLFASKEDLEKAYVVEGKSTREVGKEFGVSHVQVIKALQRYGIERRSRKTKIK